MLQNCLLSHNQFSRDIKGKILWNNVLNAPGSCRSKDTHFITLSDYLSNENSQHVRARRGESWKRGEIEKRSCRVESRATSFLRRLLRKVQSSRRNSLELWTGPFRDRFRYVVIQWIQDSGRTRGTAEMRSQWFAFGRLEGNRKVRANFMNHK